MWGEYDQLAVRQDGQLRGCIPPLCTSGILVGYTLHCGPMRWFPLTWFQSHRSLIPDCGLGLILEWSFLRGHWEDAEPPWIAECAIFCPRPSTSEKCSLWMIERQMPLNLVGRSYIPIVHVYTYARGSLSPAVFALQAFVEYRRIDYQRPKNFHLNFLKLSCFLWHSAKLHNIPFPITVLLILNVLAYCFIQVDKQLLSEMFVY